MQHTHESTPFQPVNHSIILICDGVQSPANIGGLFRLCDAFGVEKILFSSEINIASNRLQRTARATEKKVPFEIVNDINRYISEIKKQGYRCIGLEITSNSIPIQQLKGINQDKVALVIGSEQQGLSEATLHQLDQHVHIEMFGQNSSMNVTQATAIALFSLINQ